MVLTKYGVDIFTEFRQIDIHASITAVYATFIFKAKKRYIDRKDRWIFFEVLRKTLHERAYRKAQQLHDLGESILSFCVDIFAL